MVLIGENKFHLFKSKIDLLKIYKRHIAKTISWRIIGTLDTIILSAIIAGSWAIGLTIGIVEVFSKMLLYFLHERIWYNSKISNANSRHFLKTITWRGIGTLDTILISSLVTGDGTLAFQIGGAETITKMALYYFHEKLWYQINFGLDRQNEKTNEKNLVIYKFATTSKNRANKLNQKPLLLWFTGLSGSGKSTLSNAVEKFLFKNGYSTYALDGDNIRNGLNSDLDFSDEDRKENIRRIGEVSKLMLDAGLIVCASFVSPFREDRDKIREIIGEGNMIEIYVSTPLEECEKRDTKGLYQKARLGEIPNFTGISSPYEAPESPDISIDTTNLSVKEAVTKIFKQIAPKLK